MSNTIFKGAASALITPFKNGNIDFDSLKRLIEFQISNNIAALVVSGTTGECSTLNEKEKCELFEFTVNTVDGRAAVIAGTGSNDTSRACRLSKYAKDCGCDALLCVTPYYNKASPDGLYAHYRQIKEASELPLILYNVPSRTGVNIPIPTLKKLSDENIAQAIKEASGSISRIADIAQLCPELTIYSGNDDQTLPILSLGGKGVISVISNILPNETQKMCELYFEGKHKEALCLQLSRLSLIHLLFDDVNPIPVKYFMHLMGYCENEYRLPLCEPSDELKKRIQQALEFM